MPLMSQRAYARHRAEQGLPGTTHGAVQKAVAAGRIQVNAQGLIDSDAADRAWAANSSEGHRRNLVQEEVAKAKVVPPAPERRTPSTPAPRTPAARPATPPRELPARDLPDLPPEDIEARPGMSLNEASALEKVWKARLAELEYEERAGKLVPADEVEAKWVQLVTLSKTRLLALPSKAKARIPSLTAADVGVIEQLVRDALEELAAGGPPDGE